MPLKPILTQASSPDNWDWKPTSSRNPMVAAYIGFGLVTKNLDIYVGSNILVQIPDKALPNVTPRVLVPESISTNDITG